MDLQLKNKKKKKIQMIMGLELIENIFSSQKLFRQTKVRRN
jgi:hypothetical protein